MRFLTPYTPPRSGIFWVSLLQHTAAHCNTQRSGRSGSHVFWPHCKRRLSPKVHVAVWCTVLQCVVEYCSRLEDLVQFVAMCCSEDSSDGASKKRLLIQTKITLSLSLSVFKQIHPHTHTHARISKGTYNADRNNTHSLSFCFHTNTHTNTHTHARISTGTSTGCTTLSATLISRWSQVHSSS